MTRQSVVKLKAVGDALKDCIVRLERSLDSRRAIPIEMKLAMDAIVVGAADVATLARIVVHVTADELHVRHAQNKLTQAQNPRSSLSSEERETSAGWAPMYITQYGVGANNSA